MYRCEHPRPDFVRKDWENLNGIWDFCFQGEDFREIEVPFVFQSPASKIHDNRMCDYVTYRRKFTVKQEWRGKEVLLHFGAVDYECRVFVNGKLAGTHIGGNGSFSFSITEWLTWKEEELVVEVHDPCEEETIPRGKQYWEEKPDSIWYTRSTGIWQTVWLEAVDRVSFAEVQFTPDIDKGNVEVAFEVSEVKEGLVAEFEFFFKGESAAHFCMQVKERFSQAEVNLFHQKIFRTMNHHDGWCWTPENPNLFTVKMLLKKGEQQFDHVESYFGMRKIETKDGMVYLNNRPYYQKLILDQGYWPEGLMTAKEDGDFIRDIEMAKAMGFNGCRKHQKAEDPRFLYHADRLGFLVWAEIGSCVSYSRKSSQRTLNEWSELLFRDYNHPCIVAWVVLNESWGVPNIRFDKKQQAHSQALYYNMRSMDTTRLIVGNDGWELTKTDICAVHNYAHGASDEKRKQELFYESLATKKGLLNSMPAGRQIYADGFSHEGEPILLTEFGGLSYLADQEKGWGYTTIDSEEEFLLTYERILTAIMESEALFGYCYTQLSDVEQEVNGLLTYDRKYKVAPEKIKKINDMVFKMRIG